MSYRAINVKEHFGARGNGSTDDTNAIQSAINASLNGDHEPVFIPPGNYIIIAPLVIDTALYNRIEIVGAGIGLTNLTRGATFSGDSMIESTTDLVTNPTISRTLTRSSIRDLRLMCQSGAAPTVPYGIYFPVSTYCAFTNIYVDVPNRAGFIFDWHYLNNFTNCVVANSKKHGFIAGIETEVVNSNTYVNCTAVACNGIGYYINGGKSSRYYNCIAEQCTGAGMYFNRVDGTTLDMYFEQNASSGLVFNTYNDGGTLIGAPWTVKADIILNGTNGSITPSSLIPPDDVQIGYATNGVDITYYSQRHADTYSVAFLGAQGVTVKNVASEATGKNFLFHGKHHLADNITILSQGDTRTYTGSEDFDFYQAGNTDTQHTLFKNTYVQKFQDLPVINVDLSSASAITGTDGIYGATSFSSNGNVLYRLGDTAADASSSKTIGGRINMGGYSALRGRYVTLVLEYYNAFNYDDVYNNLYNGAPRTVINNIFNTGSVGSADPREISTTGTISASSNSLIVGSASGLVVGDFLNISLAGSGVNPGAHFAQVTNISGTTITLSHNATTSATNTIVITSPPRVARCAVQLPSTGTVSYGVQRLLGRAGDAIYITKMSIIPFGRVWDSFGK